MKKQLIIGMLWILVLAGWSKISIHAFAGGDGSLANPWQIASVEDLLSIGTSGDWDDAYILTQDLDLSTIEWVALGTTGEHAFSGHFNGDNHQISGLTIAIADPIAEIVSSGLFYALGDAEIVNLILNDADIHVSVENADLYLGILAGYAVLGDGEQLIIDHVSIDGDITVDYTFSKMEAHDRHIGGMIGEIVDDEDLDSVSMISNNWTTVNLTVTFDPDFPDWYAYQSDLAIGGFTGYASNVLFQSNVLQNSSLNLTSEMTVYDYDPIYVGGIVGLYQTQIDFTAVERAVFLDHFVSNSVINGLVHVGGLVGEVQSSVDNLLLEGAISSLQMSGQYFVGGLFGKVQHLTIKNARINDLAITVASPYATYIGGVFGQGENVDFGGRIAVDRFTFRRTQSDIIAQSIGGIGGRWMNGTSTAFITVVNLDIIAYNTLGGLFASAHNVTINQAQVTESIIEGIDLMGGIVGATQLGLVLNNVTFDGTIKGSSFVGGILGSLDGSTTISHAAVLGDIYSNGGYWAGGFIGRSNYNWNDESTLTITDSYARNDLHYTYASSGVGGLIGGASTNYILTSNKITLTNVYYAGQLLLIEDADHPTAEQPDRIAPIIGYDLNPGPHSFTSVYFDSTLYPGSNPSGVGIGKSTSELMMSSAYEGFDFSGLDHWFISTELNDGYATFNPGLVRIDFTDDKGQVLETRIFEPGSTLTFPDAPTKKGYTFKDWIDAGGQPISDGSTATDSMVLKANYTEGLPDTGEADPLGFIFLALGGFLVWISRRKPESPTDQ